jgi:hypothetical protein
MDKHVINARIQASGPQYKMGSVDVPLHTKPSTMKELALIVCLMDVTFARAITIIKNNVPNVSMKQRY